MRGARTPHPLRTILSSILVLLPGSVMPDDPVAPPPAPPCTATIVEPDGTRVLYGATEIRVEASCPGLEELALLVDGAVIVRAARPPFRAVWDAGGSFAPHLLEARLRDREGRSVRAAVATPGAALSESVLVSSTPLDLVEISVTVTDHEGRVVHGLTRDDFAVAEDGRDRVLERAGPERRPLRVVVLVDASSSTVDLWPRLRLAAPAFARTLGPQDAAKVIAFSGPACLVQDFTRDPGEIAASLSRSRGWGGGTSLYDTLAAAGAELAWGGGGRQAVVLLTDGIDTLSRIDAPRLRDYLRHTDVTLETLLLRPGGATATPGYARFERDIELLSRETGGSVRPVPDPDRLEDVFRNLGEELQNRYAIAYRSDRAGRAGIWRTIAVRTRLPGTTVRARAGTIAGRDIAAFLIDDLRSGDVAARRKAAEWLGTLGGATAAAEGTPALLEALADRSPEVRAAAALALARRRETHAIVTIAAWLSGGDPGLRRSAAEALGIFGPAAVPALLDLLERGSPEARVSAVQALAEIGDARAFETIATLAQPPPPLTAARDREEERAARDRRPDARLRAWALWGLGRLGSPAGVPILIRASAEDEPRIRQEAMRALDALARSGTIRDWATRPANASAFLALVQEAVEADAAAVEGRLRPFGGRAEAARILAEIAPRLPAARAERARDLAARLRPDAP